MEYYPSAEACLEAVRTGNADATYINTHVAGFLLNDSRYRGMQEAALGRYINKMCVGVSSSASAC